MNPSSSTAKATITKVEKGPYTIHSYLSPEWAEMVCSQIIETPSSLVIIDVQLLKEQAQAVREYANSLGKPINKVIISHCHPDHWAGLEAFTDVPVYALPETVQEITGYGQIMLDSKQPLFGTAVTSTVICPQPFAIEQEVIDGLELIYHKNFGTETTFSLMIELPQFNILIAQDTVYNGVYPYIGDHNYITNDYFFDTWVATLNTLKTAGYETIFPGHGLPTDASILDTMIESLTFAKSAFAQSADGEELKRRIMAQYPDYKVVDMLDLSAYMLYNNPIGY
ncbi:MBL fold metallo-hydrolase [Spirosoma endophyticum]|uniref:Glyoxylase, beta-lactamase superfamily II n=1 Tax=Spirosoma endophyticum TaxID=662367 RepID=A0A1I1IJG2_9BACT|nr:MBL fold metallo-hydrolase [Spirosoma endophyticum]SFC36387.1 Glyoxylase, beta-lactamase superfamily II [Spirosoma endophyticum]